MSPHSEADTCRKYVVPKLTDAGWEPATRRDSAPCGTGGFLAEAYEHLAKQAENTKDRRVLQQPSLFGQEAKPLSYMLGQMDLLLYGLEYPSIAYLDGLQVQDRSLLVHPRQGVQGGVVMVIQDPGYCLDSTLADRLN